MKNTQQIINHLGASLVMGLLLCASSCEKRQAAPITSKAKKLWEKEELLKEKDNIPSDEYIKKLHQYSQENPEDFDVKMELAQLYTNKGNFKSAGDCFEAICTNCPNHPNFEFCKYQQILAFFNQACTLKAECDSSDLELTQQLCQNYLQDPSSRMYNPEVQAIKDKCLEKILNKKISIFNFYLRRSKLSQAKHVLDDIKQSFSSEHNQEVVPKILYLECKLAGYQKDEQAARMNLELLKRNFPSSEFTQMAQGVAQTCLTTV